MPAKYLYLLIDLAAVSIPFLWSFEKKVNFIQYWKAVTSAMLLTMILFIPWDIYFTQIGVWGFNDDYLSGIFFFGLPIEEYLFFICIPYASIFTHEALKYYIPSNPVEKVSNGLTFIIILFLVTILIIGYPNWYTVTASLLALLVIIILKYLIKSKELNRYYLSYLIILIPFFIVNGLLTGSFIPEQVVWYNNEENLNFRIGTIPIEDTVYGFSLLLINMSLFEYFKDKKVFS